MKLRLKSSPVTSWCTTLPFGGLDGCQNDGGRLSGGALKDTERKEKAFQMRNTIHAKTSKLYFYKISTLYQHPIPDFQVILLISTLYHLNETDVFHLLSLIGSPLTESSTFKTIFLIMKLRLKEMKNFMGVTQPVWKPG